MSDLYLDRNKDVWRKVNDGSLVRLTLGGYISPPYPAEKVEADWGPLHELAPIERGPQWTTGNP